MLADELPVHRARRAARANPELHVSSAAVANDLSSATNDSPDHLGYLEVLGIGDMDSLLGEGQTCNKKKVVGRCFSLSTNHHPRVQASPGVGLR